MKKLLLMLLAMSVALGLLLGTVGCTIIPADPTAPTEEVTSPTEVPTNPTTPTQPPVDNTLSDAKAAAKVELDAYTNPADYREAQRVELSTAIANGKTAIDAATDVEAVNAALAAAKAAIDGIKTDAQLTAEEEAAAAAALAAAKDAAKAELDSYANPADYREAQQAELATAIANGKTAIDAATDVDAVNAALAAAKAAIDGIKTNAQLTAEEEAAAAAALAAAKDAAKAELDSYANSADYREAQKAELATAIANGKTAIDAAANVSAVEAALNATKTAIDAIDTDADIIAKSPTIVSPFDEKTVFTNNRATLDVYAKDASGNKLSYSKVSVTVNGVAATINWDDHIKTSYNFVFEAGENTVIITATDGNYHTTVTYTVICDMEAAATITVAIEAFTVGLGYIVEPYKLTLDEATLTDMAGIYGYADAAEMKEKLSAAHCLDYTLYLHGLSMSYSGALESTWNGFYMSSISGIADTSCIEVPEVLLEVLEMNGYYVDPYVSEDGTLCEFDVTWGSGWMYMMNNSFPNIPFCDYVPQDGDVLRVQFTLAYGADLGDWGFMGEPFFEAVDRDALPKCIADAIEAGVDYTEAFEVVSAFGVTQDELDAACEALRTLLS